MKADKSPGRPVNRAFVIFLLPVPVPQRNRRRCRVVVNVHNEGWFNNTVVEIPTFTAYQYQEQEK